jgi:heat shock protein HtpX
MAHGLQTSIWNNNIRSFILLAVYPFIIMALIWAVIVTITFLGFEPRAMYTGASYMTSQNMESWMASQGPNANTNMYYPSQAVAIANTTILMYWPSILSIVVGWFVIAYFWNTSMIRALSHAHPVTRKEEPELYNLLENLCIAQGIPMPKLNVIETHARNAFASGIDRRSYTVTVTRGLLNSLSKDEVEGVLAHELTHIINADVRLLMVTVIFTGMVGFAAQMCWSGLRHSFVYRGRRGGRNGGGFLIVLAVGIVLWIGYMATLFMRFAISRRREYMADAGAVQMTKNPDAMMRALMRIAGRDNIPQAPADIDMMCIENAQPFMGLFATHPPIDDRIAAISEMTGIPVPVLPHAGPTTPDQSFGDRKRRNPWLSAERHKR